MSLAPQPAENADKGRHYGFIESTVSAAFKTTTVSRIQALAAVPLKIEPWYSTKASVWPDKLAAANLKAWTSQNTIDHLLEKTDLYAFAEALLKAEIKQRHGLDLDVKATWLRLYAPQDTPWYAFFDIVKGSASRTVSLLDAALHNFAQDETVESGSQYINKPDARGLFDILPIKQSMSIPAFQTLCRELDIGARYKKHLESILLPGEPVAEAVLQTRVTQSQKDALGAAAHMALIRNDIQYDAFKMLMDLAQDIQPPLLNGRAMRCCDLSILGTRLTGVLLLVYAVRGSAGVTRMIAYVPQDPEHPLKEYDSLKRFKEELTRQLREDKYSAATRQTYRQFFSQFVDQQQRGHFFAELEQQLFTLRYHPRTDPTDQSPPWRKDPVDNPKLRMQRLALQGNYWRHAYQQKLNKILNDAREIAVSTADTDSKARWAWWDNFKKIVSDIFNVALLVATPFVPGLGELMMAWTAYQLTTDVIEGIVDLAEGLGQEAAEHVISVVTDVIQLAAVGAGAQIGELAKVKLSPLVDAMQPVKLPNGKPSLWHRDLSPYARDDLTLSAQSKPDRHGLHRHAGADVLPLEGNLYVVEKASTDPASKTHRIQHPHRPNAYQPRVEHNGHGAWVHEAESPADWPDARLMPRLGHSVEGFSPTQLEQIRVTSGTNHHELRQMHNENGPPPPLLADTIKRFSAHEQVLEASARIRNGESIEAESVWLEPILTSLPGWPPARALEVFASQDLTGYSRKYGNPLALPADTLRISLADLNAGQLPERVAGFLRDDEFNNLLGPAVPPEQRVPALRNQLADAVNLRRSEVARHVYQAGERGGNGELRVIRQSFAQLPLPLAEKVVAQARPAELQRIHDEQRLPLRLKTTARELDFEASTTRAYEGFYRDEPISAQTERLALNTLKIHSDSFADLRIEVLDGTPQGPLRCSAGPADARTVRRLIRNETGRYEVRDGNGHRLHADADFYESILRALPDEALSNLGYRRGQGSALKLWIMETCAPPAERRVALAEPPIRPVAPRDTELLVRGWPRFLRGSTPEEKLQSLYPRLEKREIIAFLEALASKGEPVDAITRLENERLQLHDELRKWRESYVVDRDPETGHPHSPQDYLRNGGDFIERRLIECFDRESEIFGERSVHPEQGYTLDLSTELSRYDLERWWKDLRQRPAMKPFFDRITALKLDRAMLPPDPSALLSNFPNLRQLSARQCGLKELPPILGLMRKMQDLDLADNKITLTAQSSQDLGALEDLRTLNLDGNHLQVPPDVGRMDHLTQLHLAKTRLQSWPKGLFEVGGTAKMRPRSFMLDMRETTVNTLPVVTPGSDQAFILSRARIEQSYLSNEDRVRYGQYRQSTGFTFVQEYLPAASDELSYWQLFPHSVLDLGPSRSLSKYREESWHDLMAEPESEGFFSVIRKQRESADYLWDEGRRRLTQRVWDMVDATALDSRLREKMFKQAVSADDCGDLGTQLFNSLGLKVLVSKAYTDSTSPAALEQTLVRLARGASRLNRVTDEAKFEYESQKTLNETAPADNMAPDEAEVHLAFETGLAARLQLPWQTETMLYRGRSNVTEEKIDAAYATIIKAEKGDGLVNAMLNLRSENFWEEHLRKTYPAEFELNNQTFAARLEQLEDLRTAKAEWANPNKQTNAHVLARRMQTLADQLGISNEPGLFDDAPMRQERYDELVTDMGYQRQELARRLTREALARAGL
ncbi:MAG TPA: DUF6543 domain-containing protein [Pseudomonas sp.]|uniref:dermonecrotic toxin domain-containing protein n=1 Tax=Pseudomonas sp. TaxID=306 RepID=UPI002B945AE9|nr:DUF6543 domain-containing protein [Pseudomonas sp.]HWH87075.1 DUF6543 domain-containing protein [Pseudomonas sp.]